MISPLQITEHRLFEVAFKIHMNYSPPDGNEPSSLILHARDKTLQTFGEAEPPYLRINVATQFEHVTEVDEVEVKRVILFLKVNGEDEDVDQTPYSFRIVIGGTFRAYNLPDQDDARREAYNVVRANGAALLYGLARQMAQSFSLQASRPGLVLPSLSFQTVIEHEIEVETEGGDEHD